MDDDIEIPGLKYLRDSGISTASAPSVSVSVGAPSIYDNAKPISTTKAPVDTANLQPDLLDRINQLKDLWKSNKELNPKGEDLPITSGYRTLEQQREEYKNRLKNPNLVAEPGKSRHEKGDAVDIHPRVPDSLLAVVGLHRPYGAKDPVHVQINPNLPYESNVEPNTGDDIEIPALKFIDRNYEKPEPQPWYKTFGKSTVSLADTALNTIPAGAQFVAEPVAKLIDRIGDTKVAEEALNKVTNYFDRPVGKALGITQDPTYNAEATHRLMDFAGEHIDKGAQYISDKTGMDKSDAQWFINATLIAAGPAAYKGGKLVKEVGQEALPMVKEQMQAQYKNVKNKVQEKLPSFMPEVNPNLRSVNASEVPKVQQRINNARSLLEPIELPRDIATRDFADIQFAREKAKEPEIGAPLRQNYAKINEQVIRNFDKEIEATGAQLTGIERGELGQRLNDVVNTVKKERYNKIQDAYNAADTAGETLQQVPYKSITDYIADKRPTVVEQNPILKQVKEELEHNDPNKTGSISLRQMEDIRQLINSEVEPGTSNGFHGKKIREDIDKLTEGQGGALYQQARALNHQYMKEFEETPSVRNITSLKKNTTERNVPLETLAEKTMLSGPRSHVIEVFKTLENAGPEGQAMINELRGIVAEQIKNESLQSARLDVNGNPTVSADKLNKIINKLDKSGKLELIFGKQGAERYRTLNEVSKDIYTVPEGSVNTSNTGATVKGYLADIAASYTLSGVPAPIAHIGMMGKNEIIKRRDLNRINEFINYGKDK
jgi:polyhydroxyalkanoate synthesis regulator phasin